MQNFNPFKYFTALGILIMCALAIMFYLIIESASSNIVHPRPYADVELCHDHEHPTYNKVIEYRHCHEDDLVKYHPYITDKKHYNLAEVL